ncbi:hypothetical protein HID58_035246, partial [Brassica napus]
HSERPREKLSQTRIQRRLRWISPASATLLFLPPSEAAMLLSMAMMVITPPSCLRPPPDPPPSSYVTLFPMLLSSHRSSAHHVPFRAGFHHAVAVSSTLSIVAVASPLGVINAGASQLEGGLTGSGRSHLFDYMHRQPDLIPATPPPPGRVTTGRETSSPLRSHASPMQSPQEALPSENLDSSSFIQSLSSCLNSLLIVALEVLVKPQYIFNVVDIVIYSLLDSHSPSILVNAKSSQLGLCFLYGHGASHQKLLSVIIPTVAYRCINVVFDYQLALGKKMKFLHGTLYTAELDSIFQCFVMLFIIVTVEHGSGIFHFDYRYYNIEVVLSTISDFFTI